MAHNYAAYDTWPEHLKAEAPKFFTDLVCMCPTPSPDRANGLLIKHPYSSNCGCGKLDRGLLRKCSECDNWHYRAFRHPRMQVGLCWDCTRENVIYLDFHINFKDFPPIPPYPGTTQPKRSAADVLAMLAEIKLKRIQ